jgi:hypothetical protein
MQRRATWVLAIAAAALLAVVLLVPGTASANWGPLGKRGMVRLNWGCDWRAGATGHTRRYLVWTSGVGTLGVPDNKGMRITTTGWRRPTGWWRWPPGRRVWIVDNNSPLPQDRWYVSYTHFSSFRLDVTPATPPPTPTPPPEKPKKPPVVINQESITNFLNQNVDQDTANKVQGVLDALNGHNAPPP